MLNNRHGAFITLRQETVHLIPQSQSAQQLYFVLLLSTTAFFICIQTLSKKLIKKWWLCILKNFLQCVILQSGFHGDDPRVNWRFQRHIKRIQWWNLLEGLQVKAILCNASESVPFIAVIIPQVLQFFFAIHQNKQCRVRMIENGFIRAFSDAWIILVSTNGRWHDRFHRRRWSCRWAPWYWWWFRLFARDYGAPITFVITRLDRSLSKSPTSMCCATFIWVSGSRVCTGRTYMRFRRMPFASWLSTQVHRSYNYSSIQIEIYDNRLEITSPERLPMGRPLNAWSGAIWNIRNDTLASAFDTWVYRAWGQHPACDAEGMWCRIAGIKIPWLRYGYVHRYLS